MAVIRLPGAMMAALVLQLSSMVAAQTSALPVQRERIAIDAHVAEASRRFGLPQAWIYAVIRAESGGRVTALSPAGAMGLMQLMPATWAEERARLHLGTDPFDPRDNILAGAHYLRAMYDRYGERGFLAAYNAGPARYEQWLAGTRALPLETRRYVAAIAAQLQWPRVASAPKEAPREPRSPTDATPEPARSTVMNVGAPPLPRNPFARAAQPPHDLFVPVATVARP